MKNDPLLQFTNLRKALLVEKSNLAARLANIDRVLGIPTEPQQTIAPAPTSSTNIDVGAVEPKRKVSKATRAKMAAAQQARHAKSKPATNTPAQPAEPPKLTKEGKKRAMSPAAKAAISAAAKARWAKKQAGQKHPPSA